MSAATHSQRFPHARGSTIAQKAREDAMTERLKREYLEKKRAAQSRPWWHKWVEALAGRAK